MDSMDLFREGSETNQHLMLKFNAFSLLKLLGCNLVQLEFVVGCTWRNKSLGQFVVDAVGVNTLRDEVYGIECKVRKDDFKKFKYKYKLVKEIIEQNFDYFYIMIPKRSRIANKRDLPPPLGLISSPLSFISCPTFTLVGHNIEEINKKTPFNVLKSADKSNRRTELECIIKSIAQQNTEYIYQKIKKTIRTNKITSVY